MPNRPRSHSHNRLETVLDAIATRTGMIMVFGFLLCACLSAGLYVQSTVQRLDNDHAIFRDAQIRNGYVAMSDVQRLVLVTQDAASVGQMTPELTTDFNAAADIIYARITNFSRIIQNGNNMESGAASIAALENVLTRADRAFANGFPDVNQLNSDLIKLAETARHHLVLFLDVMRRKSDNVLDLQSLAVRQQQTVVTAALTVLTILSGVAFQLLRREVLGRRAREAAEQKALYLAYYDQLTGLPNRSMFQAKLREWLGLERDVTLMFLDLDGFKLVNDTYGHAAGDAVLKHVATAVKHFMDAIGGFVTRLDGDKFALIVPTVDMMKLSLQCENLIGSARNAVAFEGEAIQYGFSIGMATSQQTAKTGSVSFDHLCRVTDFALNEAKSKGRNSFAIYDQKLEQRFLDRRALIEELPTAEQRDELRVFLQPKVAVEGWDTIGFEALVRWQRGAQMTQPDLFIQVAEETGLIQNIDYFVMREATKAIAAWNARYGTAFSVSVNLSGLHFSARRIVNWVEQALLQSQLPPELLTIEITETIELSDVALTNEILTEISDLGVRISIDDFGTGYSSLAYLRAIVADELKIDRSLVTQIDESSDARALLASVLDIARITQLSVVVEGVENADQLEILSELGVDTVQGYYFGKPKQLETALQDTLKGVRDKKVAS